MTPLDAVNAFFNDHLLKIEYFTFGREARQAALNMAAADIRAELGRDPDPADYLELAALGEQTIHLLRHQEELNRKTSQLVSERVEGVGSRTYRASDLPEIAPRARRYLRALLGGALALNRG